MRYLLAPFIHATVIDERLVVLDVGRDRYRLFGPRAAAAIAALVDQPETADRAVMAALARAAVIDPGIRPLCMADIAPPLASAMECSAHDAAPVGAVAVAHAMAGMALRLRLFGLRAVLESVRSSQPDRTAAERDALLGAAQAFARARLHIPLPRRCLRDSLVLFEQLGRQNLSTSLVIGVRLDPFGAHCWVQADDIVLNDRCDSVSGYRPILVL